MTTHVFIVDLVTFKYHLEYMFAGTGAKDETIDFNNSPTSRLNPTIENMLVGMTADANRIRKGDLILFYVQQNLQKGIYEGKFFGIFQAVHDWSFLDNNDEDQYLQNELWKSLTFRTLVEPYKVYAEGVTEWEALDEIKHIQSPNQMLWSLIYRKLKGNRGNTMITIYESERLCQLIRNKNSRNELASNNKLLSFDMETQTIVIKDEPRKEYAGRREDLVIFPRLKKKCLDGKSFEPHLQSYIVRNIGKGLNETLDSLLPPNCAIEWFGNEVSCGVGMQRIDVMLSVIRQEQRIIIPIELKACQPNSKNVIQIQRYIDWIEQYYIPNRQSDIQPVLIAETVNDEDSPKYRGIVQSFNEFNNANQNRCQNLKYVEFDVTDNSIDFREVQY
jgi:predicted RNA-binding protein